MNCKDYIGHPSQLFGVEEHILDVGYGKGMKLLHVKNGKGLEFDVVADRCADISRVSLDAVNLSYFGACGYVAPAFYDNRGDGFLKSFYAGFLTTCGLSVAGASGIDGDEEIPLHGNIGHVPAERFSYEYTDDAIIIKAFIRSASLYGECFTLERTFDCSLKENKVRISDTITNIGHVVYPLMLLYHFNIGYPLLTENAKMYLPSAVPVIPRDPRAAEGTDRCRIVEKPTDGFTEQCYYYDVPAENNMAKVGIFNPDIEKGFVMRFTKDTLDRFCQWKMNGLNEYVMGFEPGNCLPDGRAIMREKGILKHINPGEKYNTAIEFDFIRTDDALSK